MQEARARSLFYEHLPFPRVAPLTPGCFVGSLALENKESQGQAEAHLLWTALFDFYTLLSVSWVPDPAGTTYRPWGNPDACLKGLSLFTEISLPSFCRQMGPLSRSLKQDPSRSEQYFQSICLSSRAPYGSAPHCCLPLPVLLPRTPLRILPICVSCSEKPSQTLSP